MGHGHERSHELCLPVIATDAVGAAAGGLVVQGETGLVIPQRDPRALAAGIRELIGRVEETPAWTDCSSQGSRVDSHFSC